MRFRSRQHLRRQADFAALRREGRRQFLPPFVFSIRRCPPKPGRDLPRFAVVASRRVGNAVARNLLKRRLREIFRAHQAIFPPEVDVVVTLQPRSAGTSHARLEEAFLKAARRAGFFPGAPATAAPPPADPPADAAATPGPA